MATAAAANGKPKGAGAAKKLVIKPLKRERGNLGPSRPPAGLRGLQRSAGARSVPVRPTYRAAEQPKLPANFEQDTWAKLEDAVDAVHCKRTVACSLEELYRVSRPKGPQPWAAQAQGVRARRVRVRVRAATRARTRLQARARARVAATCVAPRGARCAQAVEDMCSHKMQDSLYKRLQAACDAHISRAMASLQEQASERRAAACARDRRRPEAMAS
jgi:hypothetical protein